MSKQSYNDSLTPREKTLGIENRNFLSPVGFKFVVQRLRGVDFYCQAASIPAVAIQSADTGTRFNKIPQPGDELYYEDLTIRFLIDENMKNYYQVHDWMRELSTPYSSREFKYNRGDIASQNKRTEEGDLANKDNQWRTDCSLFILSSNYQPVAEFIFRDTWPSGLSTLTFDAAVNDIQYFTAEATFRYNYFDYFIYEAAEATDASMKTNYRKSTLGLSI